MTPPPAQRRTRQHVAHRSGNPTPPSSAGCTWRMGTRSARSPCGCRSAELQVTAALKAAGIGWRSSRKRCPVDDDCLRSMVLDGAASPTTLARRYGVARNTAARWLADAGLLDKDPAIDEHRLRQLYVDQQLTTREVAKALGVNKTKILLALAAAGIVARPREMKRPRPTAASVTADAVTALYSEPGMTMRKAAAHFGVSIDCISRRLIELGIPSQATPDPAADLPSAELRNQAAELTEPEIPSKQSPPS